MTGLERHLHVVRAGPAESDAAPDEIADVGVTLMLFLVAALPLASALAGVGWWDEGSLGLGTLGVLLAGRELWAGLRAARRCRCRTRPRAGAG